MNMNTTRILIALSALLFASEALAEYRTWTQEDGTSINAEYLRKTAGIVVVKKEDGAQIKLNFSSLNEQNQQFVLLQNPPRLNINFARKNEERTVGYFGSWPNTYQLIHEALYPVVTIDKNARDDYNASLVLDLAVIGKMIETQRYVMLDRTTQEFRFTDEDNEEFIYEVAPIDLSRSQGSVNSGVEYYGYVASISDSFGYEVALKANRIQLKRNATELLAAEPNAEFNKNFEFVRPRSYEGTVRQHFFNGEHR